MYGVVCTGGGALRVCCLFVKNTLNLMQKPWQPDWGWEYLGGGKGVALAWGGPLESHLYLLGKSGKKTWQHQSQEKEITNETQKAEAGIQCVMCSCMALSANCAVNIQ